MKQRSDVLGLVLMLVLSGAILSCTAPAEETGELESVTSEATPAFKFMVLINKLEDISFEEYERYFFEEHLPYVLRIPGLRAYKVNLRHPDDDEAPYDGISEFWFDDRAAFEEAMASPETEATLADAATFLMPPQILLVDERVVLPVPR